MVESRRRCPEQVSRTAIRHVGVASKHIIHAIFKGFDTTRSSSGA
jgi:hypothetical protein